MSFDSTGAIFTAFGVDDGLPILYARHTCTARSHSGRWSERSGKGTAVKKLLFLAVTAFILGMATLPASAQYQPMFITVTPTAVPHCGAAEPGQVTINAGYFEAGSTVTVTLQSDPVTLGTTVASETGTIAATFALPADTTAGAHSVIATGPRADTGMTDSVSAAITVVTPAGCVSNITATPTTTGGGNLPVTGSDNGIFVAIGAGLLVAGGLLVMAARRRSTAG